MDKQKAETIAQWWADRMDDKRKNDMGDAAQENIADNLVEILNNVGFKVTIPEITQEQKDVFKVYLASMLMTDGGKLKHISVDYDPDEILEDALELAGIKINPFPIKTVLWPESMTCRIGYSGERKAVEVAE